MSTISPLWLQLICSQRTDLWRKLALYVAVPCLFISGVNAWRLWTEHWEHKSHEGPIEERTEYPYMNIRTKNFFWGDGDKVCQITCICSRLYEGKAWMLEAE